MRRCDRNEKPINTNIIMEKLEYNYGSKKHKKRGKEKIKGKSKGMRQNREFQ